MLEKDSDEWITTDGRYPHVYTYLTVVLYSLHFALINVTARARVPPRARAVCSPQSLCLSGNGFR